MTSSPTYFRDFSQCIQNDLSYLYIFKPHQCPNKWFWRAKRINLTTEVLVLRAHVAKFYGRLRLICSVWRASKVSVFKIDRNCNFVGLLHHRFWLQFILILFCHYFSKLHCSAKDHWRGFSTRHAHMVHIVNLIRLKMVYTP